MKHFLILSLFLLFPLSLFSAEINQKELLAKQKNELSKAGNASDSIKILYNIFDLSSVKERPEIGRKIFDVALKKGDKATMFDIARLISLSYTDEPSLNKIINGVSKISVKGDSPKTVKEKKETILFLKLRNIAFKSRYQSEENKIKAISEILAKDDFEQLSEHGKIERLYTICQYLSTYVKSGMLVGYVDALNKLISNSDIDLYSIYNQFYTSTANMYTSTGNYRQAIEADRKLLEIIDNLESKYASQGREFRNYDANRYIVYRRMLTNYEGLTLEEVNDIYGKILELARRDEEVREDLNNNKRATIFYLVDNGRYREAIPLIKQQLRRDNLLPIKRKITETYITAAKKTGNKDDLINALELYTDVLNESSDMRMAAKYSELRIRYDVNRLQSENSHLELKQKKLEVEETRKMMTFMMVGWLIFAILLVILLFYWSRYRRSAYSLGKLLDSLAKERDLLKDRLYHDAGRTHEKNIPVSGSSPSWSAPNAKSLKELTQYILNDLMYIASIGSDNSAKFVKDINIDNFLNEESDRIKSTLGPDVEFETVLPQENFSLKTDKECLTYVLRHIMGVAADLVPAGGGKMGLRCVRDEAHGVVRFEFTHTGAALPHGEEEKIFMNFLDINEVFKQEGAALFICRMTTFLINSSLKSDRNYAEGGKMILTIPLHNK